MELYKATISGSYRTANKDVVDFENVVGYLPKVDEDVALMHIRGRYAVLWIKSAVDEDGEKVYPARVEDMRQTFIDKLEVVDGDDLSFLGKDIKEMTYEELQDLATFKDLRRIPLPKELSGVSLREMRAIAYAVYSEEVLRTEPVEDASERFADLEPLVVEGSKRRDTTKKLTNEEVIAAEGRKQTLGGKPSDAFTLEELKTIAKQKNITYHHNIGRDKLYALLFGGE